MALTSYMEFIVEISDEELFNKCISNLESKIEFTKESKNGERKISFNNAVLDYTIIDGNIEEFLKSREINDKLNNQQNENSEHPSRLIRLLLPIGNENAIRIDKISLALCDVDYSEFYKFRVVKTVQYQNKNGTLIEL